MDVVSDGLGNLSVGYELSMQNGLLPTIANAAAYGSLSLGTNITGGVPGSIASTANPAVIGQLIADFMSGDIMTYASPNEILTATETVTPTTFPTVHVNWSGDFSLLLTLEGQPLVEIDSTDCIFDVQGTGVDLGSVQP
ncbi:MAG: hypothetical protein WCE62_02700 [Polyangiales bacterium]